MRRYLALELLDIDERLVDLLLVFLGAGLVIMDLFLLFHDALVEDGALVAFEFLGELFELQRLVALPFELLEICLALGEYDIGLGQFLFDALELMERAQLLVLVHADARYLLDELSALDPRHLDEVRDVALEDDIMTVGVDVRFLEYLDDFASRHLLVVDLVDGGAVVLDDAREFQLREPFAEDVLRVVEPDSDLALFRGLLCLAAVVDEVSGLLRAQPLGARLAEYEDERIEDVGLARAVGTEDAVELLAEDELGLVRERLEALHLHPRYTSQDTTPTQPYTGT